MVWEKFGIPLDRQLELDTLTYNRILRDSLVLKLKETEGGQEYLKKCWRFRQTEPDFSALKNTDRIKQQEVTKC